MAKHGKTLREDWNSPLGQVERPWLRIGSMVLLLPFWLAVVPMVGALEGLWKIWLEWVLVGIYGEIQESSKVDGDRHGCGT